MRLEDAARGDGAARADVIAILRDRFLETRRALAAKAEELYIDATRGRAPFLRHRLPWRRRLNSLEACYAEVYQRKFIRLLRELNNNLDRLDPTWTLWSEDALRRPLTPEEKTDA